MASLSKAGHEVVVRPRVVAEYKVVMERGKHRVLGGACEEPHDVGTPTGGQHCGLHLGHT